MLKGRERDVEGARKEGKEEWERIRRASIVCSDRSSVLEYGVM